MKLISLILLLGTTQAARLRTKFIDGDFESDNDELIIRMQKHDMEVENFAESFKKAVV